MVTAELAVGLPALVVVTAATVLAQAVVVAQLRCTDAAAVAARLAARGEPPDVVRRTTLDAAPAGADLTVSTGPQQVAARVTAVVRPFGPVLPALTVSARTVQAPEPGVGGTTP